MAQSGGSQCLAIGGWGATAPPTPVRRRPAATFARPAASVGCGKAAKKGHQPPRRRVTAIGPPALLCVVPGVSVLGWPLVLGPVTDPDEVSHRRSRGKEGNTSNAQ